MKQISEYLWIICFVVSVCGESDALPICKEGPLSRFIATQSDISMTLDNPIQAGAAGSVLHREKIAKRPDPCETTNYRIIDDPDVRQAFLELWEASRTDLPMDQRSEQGGWIVSTQNSGYEVIPFPADWSTSPCGIDLPADFIDQVPPNIVGVVHTHPFFEGEDITAPDVCGEEAPESYESESNYNDLDFLIRLANHQSDYCIKSFIIDGDHIFSMTPLRELAFYPTSTIFHSIAGDFGKK